MDATSIEEHMLDAVSNEENTLILIIKCHYSIDKILEIALNEVLPQSDAIELKRVSLLLKVDFLTALGGLNPQTRKLFDIANSIRNKFAHDPFAQITDADTKKTQQALVSHIPPLVPKEFKEENSPSIILRTLFSVCFLQAAVAYENSCKKKIEYEISMEMAKEFTPANRVRTDRISIMEEFKNRCESLRSVKYPKVPPYL